MLPRRQQQVIEFIHEFHKENNRYPFQDEISDSLNLYRSQTSNTIKRLRDIGFIKDEPVYSESGKPRFAVVLNYEKINEPAIKLW